ncbi:unnamed protein product, partial [Mesorhabditis spiculigera]
MTAKSAVDTCLDVIRIIAEARRLEKWPDQELEVQQQLVKGHPVSIVVQTAHQQCGAVCAKARLLEIWTIKREIGEEAAGGMDPFFLLSAVRSQLHFSPLHSWQTGSQIPPGVGVISSLKMTVSSQQETLALLPELHAFPPSKRSDGYRCSVSLRFLRAPALPTPITAAHREVLLVRHSTHRFFQWKHCKHYQGHAAYSVPTTVFCPDSLETPRILFSDSLEATSPQPLSSPLSRFLQDTSKMMDGKEEQRTGRSIQRSKMFNRMGLPTYSSPAPPVELKRRRLRSGTSICLDSTNSNEPDEDCPRLASSAPSSKSLLCNFEESALHGRLDPLAEVGGFICHLVVSNGPLPSVDLRLPVRACYFENDSDTAAPSPYLGICSLESISKRGIRIPPAGTLQVTLLNPQGTVVRIFVQRYDFTDMAPRSTTFLRQRTFFMKEGDKQKWLRYLVHFKIRSDKQGGIRLHSDLRMLFAPNNTIDALNIERTEDDRYVLKTFTETPRPTTSSSSRND